MASRGTRYTPEQREEALALIRAGKGRNEVSRATGVAAGTITKWADAAGLSFDRTATADATEARKTDLAARRADALAREMDILEQVQTYVLDVGHGRQSHSRIMKGAMGAEDVQQLDFLPSDDAQRLANARSSSVTVINRLTDTNAGEQAAKGLLGKIADELGIVDGTPE